jgi:hypothetical protein
MNHKIVFLTFHNWKTKRQGGFHKFAEKSCHKGNRNIFFSFERPYYTYFKNHERQNREILKALKRGIEYEVGNSKLLNITYPTFALPGVIRKWFSPKINSWFQTHSFVSFRKFALQYFAGTDFFIFESNETLLLYKIIKKMFPKSKYIYRPSDPLMADPNGYYHSIEKMILKEADWIFIVNKEGFNIYKNNIPGFENQNNFSILSNGISNNEYLKLYPKPTELRFENTALYVGANEIEWDLIIFSSKAAPEIKFIIVCPEKPPSYFISYLKNANNLIYLPGIPHEQVPSWVTNCDCIIIPYRKFQYQRMAWGLTAKYYQAMVARKPIVAFHDQPEFKELGIHCSYEYEDFIKQVRLAIKFGPVDYQFDLSKLDWEIITDLFFQKLDDLI